MSQLVSDTSLSPKSTSPSTPQIMRSLLFGNPTKKPQFSAKVVTPHGDLELADPRATRALVAIMDMHAVIGGAASHYGGPAAFAELMSAAHGYMFWRAQKEGKQWHELFRFVNDAGHCENGLYALKANYGVAGLDFNSLKKFRSIESNLTGHGESHLFPEGVELSNGPLGSAFPQAEGLAMGEAFGKSNRTILTAISDGASMEGEAREALASVPGLARKGLLSPFVLLISNNNTKLSGRIDGESFSMDPTFKSLGELGWKVIDVPQGNNLQACYDAIQTAIEFAQNNPTIPVAVHARTVKGIGTRKTAESSSGGHGFPCKSATELPKFIEEIYADSAVPAEFHPWIEELKIRESESQSRAVKPTVPEEKIQNGVSAALIRARKEGLPVISVTSDLPGSTGVAGFRKDFPADSFDVGVAESNMISVAAGFSRTGFIPVVDTFAQFGVTKGALPLTMASLSSAPVICIFSHTGFQDAADGASHQGLTYLGMTMAIPHVRVVALSCSEEAHALVYQAIKEFHNVRKSGHTPPSTIFFLGRENFPKNYAPDLKYELESSQVLSDQTADKKKSVCLIPVGSMVPQAMEAQKILFEKGIGTVVVNPSTLNRIDTPTLSAAIDKCGGRVVVIEDHQWIGGYGNYLAGQILDAKSGDLHGTRIERLQILAVKGEFGQSAYSSQELYAKHGLDVHAIVSACLE